jgi:molybdate transport system substrate-binding protein
MKVKSIASSLFLVLTALALCAVPAHAGDINLSVAASLREVVTELSDSFAKGHGGVTFRSNFGGSGALAKQIENGAPADIFFSANLEWMEYLKGKGLVDVKSIHPFTYNVLVFAGKPGLNVTKLQDVVKLEKIAIGSPKSVPCGEYAIDAFKKAGIDTQLEHKLVMARDVRETLLYAERGEVDGAFVYETDVEEIAKTVKVLFTVPQDLYPRVTYPMALTADGSKKAEAAAFFRFLQSGQAKAVLAKHGFVVK